MRKVTEKRLETTTGRLVRIGSSYLGIVEAEDPFSQHGRKGKLTAVVTSGEKRLEVRSDRIVGPRSAHAIDATTTAQVYLDGQSLVTQRPTLTRMVLLSPLPGSAIIPGMALQKKEKVDLRQAEFQVGGLGWSIRMVVHPDRLSGPRQLAEQINRHAKDMETKQATVVAMPPAPMAVVESNADNVLSRLERLQLLVSTGALTQDEADVLKRDILS